MARSVDEIFKFLSDGQNIAETFKKLNLSYCTWIPINRDVRSMELSKIEDRDNWIPEDIARAKEAAQNILSELDFDFQDAMLSESDPATRESLNAKYQEKRKIIVDGIKMIEESSTKNMDNWRRFKQGEYISFDEVYSIGSAFQKEASSIVSDDRDVSKEPVQDVHPDPEDTADLSDNESKSIIALLKELQQTSKDLKKAQKALRRQRFKEFQTEIEESGALYLDTSAKNADLKRAYKEKIADLKKKYNAAMEKSDENYEKLDVQILKDRATLAEGKAELKVLRKEPIIKRLESTIKSRKRIEEKLESTDDPDKRIDLEDQLKELKGTEDTLLQSDAGKAYARVTGKIAEARENITNSKRIQLEITQGQDRLEEQLKEFMQKAKEELNAGRENNLPTKRSKIMMLIGGIKAKLGIGKHKAEKNASDSIKKAYQTAKDFTDDVVDGALGGIKNIGEKIGDFATSKADSIISRMESHLNSRIDSNKQKTQSINDKIKTDDGR